MAEVGLHKVETYISRRHNTVAQFIASGTIMYLCLAAEWRLVPRVSMPWWEQDGVNVEGMKTAARKVERINGGE